MPLTERFFSPLKPGAENIILSSCSPRPGPQALGPACAPASSAAPACEGCPELPASLQPQNGGKRALQACETLILKPSPACLRRRWPQATGSLSSGILVCPGAAVTIFAGQDAERGWGGSEGKSGEDLELWLNLFLPHPPLETTPPSICLFTQLKRIRYLPHARHIPVCQLQTLLPGRDTLCR